MLGAPDYVIKNHGFVLFCISRGKPAHLYDEQGKKILETTDFLRSNPDPSLHNAIKQTRERLAASMKELNQRNRN